MYCIIVSRHLFNSGKSILSCMHTKGSQHFINSIFFRYFFGISTLLLGKDFIYNYKYTKLVSTLVVLEAKFIKLFIKWNYMAHNVTEC